MRDILSQEQTFTPLSKDQLQQQTNTFVEQIRTKDSKEVIKVISKLGLIKADVETYLEMGEHERTSEFSPMLECTPANSAFEHSQIRFLVLLSLTDDDLNTILKALPESEAIDDGFESYEQRVAKVEDLLAKYFNLCRQHRELTYMRIAWEDLVSPNYMWSVLKEHAYMEADGSFTKGTQEYFRSDLFNCRLSDLEKVEEGINFANQNLIRVLNQET